MALSPSSAGVQYLGLALAVVAQAVILQPLLWIAYYTSKSTADFQQLVLTAAVLTGVIFVGLTATVFITRKDFSFLRGGLMIASFAMLGIILASILFGFQLGLVFCAFGVAVLAGYVLYQTSLIMAQFPPRSHVAAALMLFSTIATLFWYVLQLLMSLNRR
jgi:FtsH-binding integral membrane protein